METLLVEQAATIRLIENAEVNYNKIAQTKRTLAVTEGRLQLLLERWEACRKLDIQLNVLATTRESKEIEYFQNQCFETAEEAFDSAYDFFKDRIARLRPAPAVNAPTLQANGSGAGLTPGHSTSLKLQPIELIKFSGIYTEWTNFKNMFNSIVIKNQSLDDVQRLYYLKSTVSGEAARTLQHYDLTAENFATAWATLQEIYEDKRAIIDAHFKSFLALPVLCNENAVELKILRDKTQESLKALNNLGCETESWDHIIVYLTVQKLDSTTIKDWEMQLGDTNEYPTFRQLVGFLSTKIRALEKVQEGEKTNNRSTGKQKPSHSVSETRSHSTTTNAPSCPLCAEKHSLYKCEKFKAQPVLRRKDIAKEKECCYNCLRPGHQPRNCPSKFSCAQCKKKHHTLLHINPTADSSQMAGATNANVTAEVSTTCGPSPSVHTHLAPNTKGPGPFTLLAIVNVKTATGRQRLVRALLDQGSQSTIIKESIVQSLRPKRHPACTLVNGVGGVKIGTARTRVNVILEARNNPSTSVSISALVMPTLTTYGARNCATLSSWPHISDLLLADPEPSSNDPIELIIGADYYGALLRPGLRQGPKCAPTAQDTLFGWILSGPAAMLKNQPDVVTINNCNTTDSDANLHDNLARFWEMEELPRVTHISEENRKCEEHFSATHHRTNDGRYIVRLPFKGDLPVQIGESLSRAISTYNGVKRRLQRDADLMAEYNAFLLEYEALGHIQAAPKLSNRDLASRIVYLPHHPVVRESSTTTRVRVVFNASSVTSNLTSLNDHLMVGPRLQIDITTIITRWRVHQFVYTADIAKMFRQILVDPLDVDYQRILWKRDEKEFTACQLLTVTYGMASAPFLANRVLHQLAEDEGGEFPRAAAILKNNFYVDDALFGAESIETARELRTELNSLLKRGGFHLRKWSANVEDLLSDTPKEFHGRLSDLSLQNQESRAVLGITWNPNRDEFQFHFTPASQIRVTKRAILSIIARLFDPFGWASPIIITAKIIMQELWIRKVEWDVDLPEDLVVRWQNYYNQLHQIREVHIPRWTGQTIENNACEIHGFADASTRAYAAVVYLRVLQDSGDARVTLLIAKSKVAPVNPVSIPRLELCAAVLLARTMKKVIDDLDLVNTPVYGWSDSTVTLHWLMKHPSTWQTFVANRVAEVLTLIPQAKWRYVPTNDNPADCASRGVLPSGVDYAGPLSVRLSKGRGHKTQKAYIALFICFATRAIHLELVSDYATSGFLAAFKRFVARRGIPAAMYSDNGTNFQGADKELRNALRAAARDEDLRAQIISDGTEWHFNPPSAPHFGGLWESGVKSVKHHLRRIVGAYTLTFEELTTLLCQIEACLNSRPISPLSNDPDDLSCLTPGHFLIGGPLLAIPEPSIIDVCENRLTRWQLIQQKVESFWRRWATEYLHSIQQRNKWLTTQANVQVGDLVLLRSKLNPPSKWLLGRILEVHPGKDNHVRVVTVKTANSTFKRSISKLCLLPIRANSLADD